MKVCGMKKFLTFCKGKFLPNKQFVQVNIILTPYLKKNNNINIHINLPNNVHHKTMHSKIPHTRKHHNNK